MLYQLKQSARSRCRLAAISGFRELVIAQCKAGIIGSLRL